MGFYYIILSIFLIPYHYIIKHYIEGMTEYIKYNNENLLEESLKSTKGESIELYEAIIDLNMKEIINEFCDVFHIMIKMVMIIILPNRMIMNKYCWIPLFCLCPIAAWKLGSRYKKNHCIRNHTNARNLDHNCEYKINL